MKRIVVLALRPEAPEPDVPADDLMVTLNGEASEDADFEEYNVVDEFLQIVEGVQGGGGWILKKDMQFLQELFANLDQSEKNALFKCIVGKLDASDFQVHDFVEVLQDLCDVEWVWMGTEGEDDEVIALREENARLKIQIEQLQSIVAAK